MPAADSQLASSVLMIRPARFESNPMTAESNVFQGRTRATRGEQQAAALREFDTLVNALRAEGINVVVVEDTPEPHTPDSIFPNNWVSFHENGDIAKYPMFAENRRRERRDEVFIRLESEGFIIENLVDYTTAENEGIFLEGTGSILMDRTNSFAYCALSPRADEDLFIEFCEDFEYSPVIFTAFQNVNEKRMPIYHTNVMMALAEKFAVICLDSIDNKKERKEVTATLRRSGKQIIEITEAQMHQFAGNMLQVLGADEKKYMVMSKAAHDCLTPEQIAAINKHCEILSSDLTTIETCGGGSARCMMAEVFLPKK